MARKTTYEQGIKVVVTSSPDGECGTTRYYFPKDIPETELGAELVRRGIPTEYVGNERMGAEQLSVKLEETTNNKIWAVSWMFNC